MIWNWDILRDTFSLWLVAGGVLSIASLWALVKAARTER